MAVKGELARELSTADLAVVYVFIIKDSESNALAGNDNDTAQQGCE